MASALVPHTHSSTPALSSTGHSSLHVQRMIVVRTVVAAPLPPAVAAAAAAAEAAASAEAAAAAAVASALATPSPTLSPPATTAAAAGTAAEAAGLVATSGRSLRNSRDTPQNAHKISFGDFFPIPSKLVKERRLRRGQTLLLEVQKNDFLQAHLMHLEVALKSEGDCLGFCLHPDLYQYVVGLCYLGCHVYLGEGGILLVLADDGVSMTEEQMMTQPLHQPLHPCTSLQCLPEKRPTAGRTLRTTREASVKQPASAVVTSVNSLHNGSPLLDQNDSAAKRPRAGLAGRQRPTVNLGARPAQYSPLAAALPNCKTLLDFKQALKGRAAATQQATAVAVAPIRTRASDAPASAPCAALFMRAENTSSFRTPDIAVKQQVGAGSGWEPSSRVPSAETGFATAAPRVSHLSQGWNTAQLGLVPPLTLQPPAQPLLMAVMPGLKRRGGSAPGSTIPADPIGEMAVAHVGLVGMIPQGGVVGFPQGAVVVEPHGANAAAVEQEADAGGGYAPDPDKNAEQEDSTNIKLDAGSRELLPTAVRGAKPNEQKRLISLAFSMVMDELGYDEKKCDAARLSWVALKPAQVRNFYISQYDHLSRAFASRNVPRMKAIMEQLIAGEL